MCNKCTGECARGCLQSAHPEPKGPLVSPFSRCHPSPPTLTASTSRWTQQPSSWGGTAGGRGRRWVQPLRQACHWRPLWPGSSALEPAHFQLQLAVLSSTAMPMPSKPLLAGAGSARPGGPNLERCPAGQRGAAGLHRECPAVRALQVRELRWWRSQTAWGGCVSADGADREVAVSLSPN